MSPTVRLRVLWERYVAPSRAERDPGFRAVLDGATVLGLKVAGLFGIVALVGVGLAVVITGFIGGDGMGDMGESAHQIRVALSDKLFVYAAAAVFFVVARFRPGLVLARWMLATFVMVGALVITWEELARGDLEFMAAWLSLLLLFTVGTVPFQPVQTLALGVLITVLHTGALVLAGVPGSNVDPGEAVRRLSFLVLVTFLSTAMSAALYAGRRAQYRGTLRLARLRDRLTTRGILLEARSTELEDQQTELSASLARLEAAQTRLVQQEKMASLGQLTAGVAHELKNPLNFVNNFAQLLVELLDDFVDEVTEDPTKPVGEALEGSEDLLDDLRSNAVKIREHGRRADGIIRSMLAHSRAQPGPSRPAPINSLLREYVGLAYHGTRAEHSGFNVDIVYDLDDRVGEVVMVPEEMGRVFLNLLDNALQALRQRSAADGPSFAPVLRVASEPWRKGARVRITDNGPGIPEAARAKIFEPFFTTKPTGEGTGLGLSLAYEIVVHGHGGELTVETAEGEGTTFTVGLPGTPPAPPPAVPGERGAANASMLHAERGNGGA